MDYKYITVEPHPQKAGRKTCDYTVRNRKSGVYIATIEWETGWRQHVLCPNSHTIWSLGCLRDVISFIEQITKERNAAIRPGD